MTLEKSQEEKEVSWKDLYLGRWEENMDQIEINFKYTKPLECGDNYLLDIYEPSINGDNWALNVNFDRLLVFIKDRERPIVLEHQKNFTEYELIEYAYYRVEEFLRK